MSVAEIEPQAPVTPDRDRAVPKLWLDRYKQGSEDRAKYEYIWEMCQMFTQGYQWIGYDPNNRRVVALKKKAGRERHTVDLITKHIWTQQGKLSVDDLRPDILFRRDDAISRGYADQSREAFNWAWDNEFDSETAYTLASLKRIIYGIGFIRVRFDPLWGKITDRVPVSPEGKPEPPDEQGLQELEEHGTLNGRLPKFQPQREGRIVWEAGGPLNLVTPPGVEHERDFPWLIIERPVPLTDLFQLYPEAKGLKEEAIRTINTVGMDPRGGSLPGSSRLKGHAMLKTGYCRPTREYPMGETVIWAQERLLEHKEEMPFVVHGQPMAGVAFLKYHLVDGRFWPKGMVQPSMGPQRQINVARSNWLDSMKRIGLPHIFAHENAIVEGNIPQGLPAEVILIRQGMELPKEMQGVAPGQWLADEAQISERDMALVTGTGDVSLSQVPTGVSAYSAFALFLEQDDRRIGPIRKADRIEVAKLALFSLNAMRRFWTPEKMISIKGEEEGVLDQFAYDAAELPEEIYVDISTTSPMPESQAAEAQKIMDVWNAAIASGQPLPLDWLIESLQRKKMQQLPRREMQVQRDVAEMENHLIISGQIPMPAPYHNDEMHVQIHRAAEEAYGLMAQMYPQAQQVLMGFEQHIALHIESAQRKQAQLGAQAAQALPAGGTNPGGFGALGAQAAGGAAQAM